MGEILGNQIPQIAAVTVDGWAQCFQDALESAGIPCCSDAGKKLAVYHRLLTEWNSFMNLTGDTDFDVSLPRHYMDSLVPLKTEGLFPESCRLIDVGTGAGFPGMALAIARPDFQVTLMDALNKRLKFLSAVIEELQLKNVTLCHMRAEDGGRSPQHREKYDIALARGVASMPVLAELLLPFAAPGGKALCYKGPAALEEKESGEKAAAILGGEMFRFHPVDIPGQPQWGHCIVEIGKTRKTPPQYPRKAGTPEKKPLGVSCAK